MPDVILKDYAESIAELNKNKANKHAPVFYGIDDEGNGFKPVCFYPAVKYILTSQLDDHYIDGMEMYDTLEEAKSSTGIDDDIRFTAIVVIN